jgi:hypothetical protein
VSTSPTHASPYTPPGTRPPRYSDIITFAVAIVATAALYAMFRFARIGPAMRAVRMLGTW